MPAFASHAIFAKEITDSVRACDRDIKLDENTLICGAQGPDFLFCHKIWRMAWGGKTLKPLGNDMHHCQASKLFSVMKKYLNEENCDKDIIKSYIYGFLSHYALDRMAHPLIYSIQKKITQERHIEHYEPFSVHAHVESNIDTVLINNLGYEDARKYRAQDTVKLSSHILDELSALMEYTVPRVMGVNVERHQFRLAYKHMMLAQKMLFDPKGIKRKILIKCGKPVRKKIGPLLSSMLKPAVPDGMYDYINEKHEKWAMTFDRTRIYNTSFMDLYEAAKQDTVNLINAFNSSDCEKAIRDLTGDMTFDTGLNYLIKEPLN